MLEARPSASPARRARAQSACPPVALPIRQLRGHQIVSEAAWAPGTRARGAEGGAAGLLRTQPGPRLIGQASCEVAPPLAGTKLQAAVHGDAVSGPPPCPSQPRLPVGRPVQGVLHGPALGAPAPHLPLALPVSRMQTAEAQRCSVTSRGHGEQTLPRPRPRRRQRHGTRAAWASSLKRQKPEREKVKGRARRVRITHSPPRGRPPAVPACMGRQNRPEVPARTCSRPASQDVPQPEPRAPEACPGPARKPRL